METVIAIESLTKRFGQKLAVDDLSFDVPSGSIVGFLGPNGAGKTTTLRALVGLTTPTLGRATIEGRPYAELRDPIRAVGGLRTAMSGGAAESAGAATGGLPPFWLAALLWTGYTPVLVAAASAARRRRDIL